jgi:hypothetical protein
MDPEERAQRARERVSSARERLKFKVYSSFRDVVLRTDLFREHFELHEPDISVNVYAQFVDASTCLNEAQFRLLRGSVPPIGLRRYAEQLQLGVGKLATDLHLEPATGPGPLGASGPVMLADVPIGYRAILLRPEPD